MLKLRRIFNTPKLLFTVVTNINRQKKFINERIEPMLDNARRVNDGSLDAADLKKITNYYGLAVPAILGEAFCALRGQKMTDTERLASTCQGAATGLFDDFFDKQALSAAAVKGFIENPQQLTGANANQQLFLDLYITGLQNTPDTDLTMSYVYRVYKAQIESKKQGAPGLGYEEIKDITLFKGGVSLLLYRTAFTNRLEKAEEEMLYKLGGVMQLSNDIYDVYKDQQNGIHTLATTSKKINDIRTLFITLLKEGYTAAYQTNYHPHNIKKFLNILSIGIFSRCFVCLDHLEKSESGTGNVFAPHLCSRKELVCDMDTSVNKWRSIKYHVGIETWMTRI